MSKPCAIAGADEVQRTAVTMTHRRIPVRDTTRLALPQTSVFMAALTRSIVLNVRKASHRQEVLMCRQKVVAAVSICCAAGSCASQADRTPVVDRTGVPDLI